VLVFTFCFLGLLIDGTDLHALYTAQVGHSNCAARPAGLRSAALQKEQISP
jgi:hypothetical protein